MKQRAKIKKCDVLSTSNGTRDSFLALSLQLLGFASDLGHTDDNNNKKKH